jgi:Asp/Glu/hydantoin racemase
LPVHIWHQSMTELARLGAYRDSLERHAREILEPGQVVEVHGLPAGAYLGRAPTAALGNAFAHHRILDPVLDLAKHAERQGYDAFVIGSYSEPFLTELRSALDIPVVSVAEATFLVACSIGRLAAPITNDRGVARLVRRSIAHHGLQQRGLKPRAITPALDEFELASAFSEPQAFLASFTSAARAAIADGADVIIPAEGVLSECLHHHRVTSIDSVPVMDSFGVAWLHAAMLVRLRATTGLAVSRAGDYFRDDPQLIDELTRTNPTTTPPDRKP